MRRSALPIGLLISLVATLANAQPQTEAAAADPRFFAVSYVDASPSAAKQLFAAFKAYSDATTKEDGRLGFELFEQMGRPAHYAVVETWRGRECSDGALPAAQPLPLDLP